ncbi:MAG: hypothetical protein WBJ19_05795, partial [Rhodoferax sp.]
MGLNAGLIKISFGQLKVSVWARAGFLAIRRTQGLVFDSDFAPRSNVNASSAEPTSISMVLKFSKLIRIEMPRITPGSAVAGNIRESRCRRFQSCQSLLLPTPREAWE